MDSYKIAEVLSDKLSDGSDVYMVRVFVDQKYIIFNCESQTDAIHLSKKINETVGCYIAN